MIFEGMIDEGLEVIDAIRSALRRPTAQPWNEHEAGHHYARALASWAAIPALSGFRHAAVSGRLELAPRWRPQAFTCIWTAGSGWGTVQQRIDESEQNVRWEVLGGALTVREMAYAPPPGAAVETVEVELGGEPILASTARQVDRVTITLPQETQVSAERDLMVCMRIDRKG